MPLRRSTFTRDYNSRSMLRRRCPGGAGSAPPVKVHR